MTDDAMLASEIRNDKIDAFEILYHRYSRKLYYFSLRYLSDKSDCEEIVQTVFISIWEHRKTLEESKSIKSYIYKIAVNKIYNYLKKKAIHQKYVDQALLMKEGSMNQTYDLINYKELERTLDILISSLPEQQRKIFLLSRFEGLSASEIAAKLSLSPRTVENQIFRVTKVLKTRLKE